MPQAPAPICIDCGLSIEDTSRINRLPDGRICPTCRERILANLAPALPRSAALDATLASSRVKARRSRRPKSTS